MAESGYPGFEAVAWHGILAPANTPAPIINKLYDQIVAALDDPPTRALIVAQSIRIVGDTPQEFAAFIKKDIAQWKAVATQANISISQ